MSKSFDQQGFAARLRDARMKASTTQGLIANRLGVRESTVSEWMHAKHLPGLAQLAPLAQLLDVDLNWLVAGRERPSRADELVQDVVRAAPTLQLLAERSNALAQADRAST